MELDTGSDAADDDKRVAAVECVDITVRRGWKQCLRQGSMVNVTLHVVSLFLIFLSCVLERSCIAKHFPVLHLQSWAAMD